MPVPRTRQERQERAVFLSTKRSLNRSAADQYRQRQAVMTAAARELINSLDRVPADQRAAALTQALEDLPPRGAIQPRRVLEEALAKSPVSVPVSAPAPRPAQPAAPSWTPESAKTAVADIIQAEFDKGRSADEIQQLMWQQMSTLSPSKDRVMFSALNAAMRELEAYR